MVKFGLYTLLGAWVDRACWEIKIRIMPINLPVFELFRIFALEIGEVYSAQGWLTRRCTILVSVDASSPLCLALRIFTFE